MDTGPAGGSNQHVDKDCYRVAVTGYYPDPESAMRQALEHLGELEAEDVEIEQGYEFIERSNTPGSRGKTYELKVGQEEYRVRDWRRSGRTTWLAVVRTTSEEDATPWLSIEGGSGLGTEYATREEAMSAVVERIKNKRSDTSLAIAKSPDGDMKGPAVLLHDQVAKVQDSMANYRTSAESFVRSVISLGRELNTLKGMVQHGEWLPLLQEDPMNYGLTPRRLTDFMRLAEYADQNPGQLEDVRSVNQGLELVKAHRRFVQNQTDGTLPALTEGAAGDPDEWLLNDGEDESLLNYDEAEDDNEPMDYEPSHTAVVMDMEPSAAGQEREIITQPSYQILGAEPMAPHAPTHQPEAAEDYTMPGYGDMPRVSHLNCNLAALTGLLEQAQEKLGYALSLDMVIASASHMLEWNEKSLIGNLFLEMRQKGLISHIAGLLLVPGWGWPSMFLDFGFGVDGLEPFEGRDPVMVDLTPSNETANMAVRDGWLYLGVSGPHSGSTGESFDAEESTPEELAEWLITRWRANEPE